jgi:hypothetical protein
MSTYKTNKKRYKTVLIFGAGEGKVRLRRWRTATNRGWLTIRIGFASQSKYRLQNLTHTRTQGSHPL